MIPEVVLTAISKTECNKVVSHTKNFIFFMIQGEGEKKDTMTTMASIQAPPIQQKQVKNIEAKKKYSLCTPSSHAVILVKKFQPLQHQVHDNLPQAKQCNFSSKESNSPRFRFNKCFPISHENSTQ